ncbi:hypothetical protein CYMTET_23181 [Cymbomonas tetramitiformis]|uniref:Erythromycin esterase n=1 Tax=Cymbomonas tetramitiformis TaxID=36881 RepID=A0AAE0FZW6_9CHLO|nr:hypothetical protein CYMTET_23181 [Cymbomonas tetramitiformis]
MILGLDIYSLFSSAKAVISYLRALDPLAASFAKDRYAELEKFGPEAERYSNAYYEQLVESQATNVSVTLSELLAKEPVYSIHPLDGDEFFSASENAHIVQSAEAYYRKSILGGSAVTWNLRDKSMYDTFAHTLDFLKRKRGKAAKAIVWAHNSHLGDARATEKHERQSGREINIGQLIREHLGEEKTFIIGFSTDTGTVRAATGWGRKGRKMDLVPSIQNSYGNVMHRVTQLTGFPAFGVSLTECRKSSAVKGGASVDVGGDSVDARENADPAVAARIALTEPRLERFIGVLYIWQTERPSHYQRCCLARQFDYVIHVDVTSAVVPLDIQLTPTSASSNISSPPPRPGTLDYSKWDDINSDDEDSDDDNV